MSKSSSFWIFIFWAYVLRMLSQPVPKGRFVKWHVGHCLIVFFERYFCAETAVQKKVALIIDFHS
jgi:hypothetical protein